MKSHSVVDYAALALVLLFVAPLILWTVVHAGLWMFGVLFS